MTVEEKLSKSILYNLNALRIVVRSNEQLDEVLTEGIFLRSNTQSFIQVSYFLFNILDAKEFRRKFYWPIVDKKSENSYRTSSVEFINMLIDKHGLQQEKIKQVTVVHPSGKKFMSLMLDLILIAIKEVMRRKRFNSSKSIDIENAVEIATTINQIENDLMSSLRSEMRMIREKTQEIQEILSRVRGPAELEFEEMIRSWHSWNITRINAIKEDQVRVENVFKSTKRLQEKAEDMLSDKKHAVVQPSAYEIERFREFYQHTPAPNDGNKLSIVSLIGYLQSALPIILSYVENFSHAEVSDEEMKIVRQKLTEMDKFDAVISKMMEREKFVKDKILKLRTQKEEEQQQDTTFAMEDEAEDKLLREAEEQEVIRHMLSPRYQFDVSKSCTISVVHKRNHLAFAETEDESIVDRSVLLNHTKQYLDSKLNRSRKEEMGPPKHTMQLPSRRKRRDAMQLLEQATSKKCDLNSTKYNGNLSKLAVHSTPFSSTLLSPDLIHHANLNFSMISTISTVTPAPLKITNGPNITASQMSFPKPDVLHSQEDIENLPWSDTLKMKEIQRSPVTKVDPLVSLEDAFGEDLTNDEFMSSPLPVVLPKIKLNDDDDTLKASPFSSELENTICAREDYTNATLDSEGMTTMFRKKSDDEDLFNVSDSILVKD